MRAVRIYASIPLLIRTLLQIFKWRNYVMKQPSKFEVKVLGISVSAEDTLGTAAALLVVFAAFLFYRF